MLDQKISGTVDDPVNHEPAVAWESVLLELKPSNCFEFVRHDYLFFYMIK